MIVFGETARGPGWASFCPARSSAGPVAARGAPVRRTVQQAITAGEARLGTGGRLVIRNSGTEPVIRVMAQGEDQALLASVVDDICEAILAVARGDKAAGPAAGLTVQAAE